MKKILVVFLAMLMLVSMFALTACGEDEHTHSYDEWTIITPAKCEKTGLREGKCECGEITKETIPALGHNFVGGICTDCGKNK